MSRCKIFRSEIFGGEFFIELLKINISVTSLEQLSLAELRNEKAWPQLQLGVYKKIVGLAFFLVFKIKNWAHF